MNNVDSLVATYCMVVTDSKNSPSCNKKFLTLLLSFFLPQARELFTQMCPGEEFLPHPPNPDDIIFEDSGGNHGNEAEGATAGDGESPNEDEKDQEPEAPPTITEATPICNTENPSTE